MYIMNIHDLYQIQPSRIIFSLLPDQLSQWSDMGANGGGWVMAKPYC